ECRNGPRANPDASTQRPFSLESRFFSKRKVPLHVHDDRDPSLERNCRKANTDFLSSGGTSVYRLAVSPDGNYLAAQSHEGPTQVWETATGKTLHLPKANHTRLAQPYFLADSKTLVEIHEEQVIIYDVTTGKELRRLPCGGYPAVLSPDE